MFVEVVAPLSVLITECHNSHKHSQSPLTKYLRANNVNLELLACGQTTLLAKIMVAIS